MAPSARLLPLPGVGHDVPHKGQAGIAKEILTHTA
ncbi:hypothetical protein SAMN04489726_1037 [Allokutzneria albata]|uniref:Uncharacterized protein n=1 Tax=Allokutzneria albata TaxID=211114 RepID=A0A1G9SBE2_ALLAB|nr:hypothetical protein SAMN04489726_1037 [Allokutzneria albata]